MTLFEKHWKTALTTLVATAFAVSAYKNKDAIVEKVSDLHECVIGSTSGIMPK